MADYALPVLTSTYTDLVNVLKARDDSAIKWLDGTTDSNLPSGAKRWNSTNSYFEKFNGSAWSPLAAKYMINVDLLDGCTVNDGGATTSDLWTASKITTQLSTKLDSTAYSAGDILSKIRTVDGAGSGLDADLLDGMSTSSGNNVNTIVNRDASGNFSAGTIGASLNGAAKTLWGDQTDWANNRTTAVANMLGWKNYGNNHVIFDASAGTSPNGVVVSNTNSSQPWNASYPTLMGWNGDSTHGVRVDSARVADICSGNSATATKAGTLGMGGVTGTTAIFSWSGQSGQPSWLWGGNDGTNMYVYNPANFSVATAVNLNGGSVNATTGTFSGNITANSGVIQVGSGSGTYKLFRYDGTISSDNINWNTLWHSGNAQSIGINQSWQNMTGSRASDVTYTNSTGKSIEVSVWSTNWSDGYVRCYVNGNLIAYNAGHSPYGHEAGITFIVPNGATYTVILSLAGWWELR